MEVRKYILRQTGIIAIGEVIGCALMIIAYALLGRLDGSVLLGAAIGALLAILNFFFMALAAQSASDQAQNQNVNAGDKMMKTSYLMRMVVIFAVLFVLGKSGVCNILASVLPLVFVRPTIMVADFFRIPGGKKR